MRKEGKSSCGTIANMNNITCNHLHVAKRNELLSGGDHYALPLTYNLCMHALRPTRRRYTNHTSLRVLRITKEACRVHCPSHINLITCSAYH